MFQSLIHGKTQQVEHEGFFDGAHAVPAEKGQATITSFIDRDKAKAQQRSTEKLKGAEAELQRLRQFAPAAEARWDHIVARLGEDRPKAVLPAMIVLTGFLALLAEARMLAPSFDMFSIADPAAQAVVGLAFALVAAIIFHFVLECLYSAETPRTRKLVAYTVGGFAVIWLVFFGIVRAHQAVFAAQMGENPLARFLESLPFLTTIVFASATLIFPVAAGIAITYGIQGFRNWLDFVRAERGYRRTLSRLVETEKTIASEKNLLAHTLDELTAKEKQLRHAYLVHHDRGIKMGARQMPLWMVHAKAVVVAALVFGVAFLAGIRLPALAVIPFASGVATWLYAYRARIHPTPAQYFRQQNVAFQVKDETPVRMAEQRKESL
jgi:hypothetical protein